MLLRFCLIFCFGLASSWANAELLVDFDNTIHMEGTGVRTMNVLLSSSQSGFEAGSLVFDFELTGSGGRWAASPFVTNASGMLAATRASYSDYAEDQYAGFSILTTTAVPGLVLPTTSTLLATMAVDITGLTPGAYSFTLDARAIGIGASAGSIALYSGGGEFSVTSVPEPGTMAVLGLIGGAAAWRRRRASKLAAAA